MINLTKFGSLFGLHDETVKLKNTLLKTALILDTKIIIKEFTGFGRNKIIAFSALFYL